MTQERKILPQRRACETFEIMHGNQRTQFQVTIGYFADHTPGEVFISGGKAGSEFEAVARDGAILLSLAMQHGVPLDTIRHAITRNENGEPGTIIGTVIDRLSQWLT